MADGKYVQARKNHRCSFCHHLIFKGSRYYYERLTPWDHPDNDGYGTSKAHVRCIKAWWDVGYESDWEWMDDPVWWREVLIDRWIASKRAAA